MEAASDLLRTAGQVPKRVNVRARHWVAQFAILIAFTLGAVFAPVDAWARDAGAPAPAPGPAGTLRAAHPQAVPMPAPQAPPTSAVPRVIRLADLGIVNADVSQPFRPAGLAAAIQAAAAVQAKAQTGSSAAHGAVHHRLTASAHRAQFTHSLIYSGTAALVIAGAGLMLLGARRRLW